ncbi:MAG: response regulator [Clostridiales Family XIII bacterium]|jgi:CheY-like chemotaxis protein|nr:response regulator [Clostridiales Family XIII bacterium]
MGKKTKPLRVLLALVFLCATSATWGAVAAAPRPLPEYSVITSYEEVPDISQEEIEQVKQLLDRKKTFTVGVDLSTEAFFDLEGKIAGFDALLCDWLGSIFDVTFRPVVYAREDIGTAIDAGLVDFTTVIIDGESQNAYRTTDAMAERGIKCVRFAKSKPIWERNPDEILYLGFIGEEPSALNERLEAYLPNKYVPCYAADAEEAFTLLNWNSVDAFFIDGSTEMDFDAHRDALAVDDMAPLSAGRIALAAKSDAMTPVIIAVEKVLKAGGAYHLARLYDRGDDIFKKHRFMGMLSPGEQERVKSGGGASSSVRVAFNPDAYPVSYYDEAAQEWRGKAVDILDEISAVTGLIFVPANEDADAAGLAELLNGGGADMAAGFDPPSGVRAEMEWSAPYESGYYVLASTQDYPDVAPRDAMFMKVGLVEGSDSAEAFRKLYPNHRNMTFYGSLDEAAKALAAGEVDLMMASRDMLYKITQFWGLKGYRANLEMGGAYGSAFAFAKEDVEFKSIISKALTLLDKGAVSSRWTIRSSGGEAEAPRDWTPLAWGVAALLFWIALLFLILYTRGRKKQSRLETKMKERLNELRKSSAALSGQFGEEGLEDEDDIGPVVLTAVRPQLQPEAGAGVLEGPTGAVAAEAFLGFGIAEALSGGGRGEVSAPPAEADEGRGADEGAPPAAADEARGPDRLRSERTGVLALLSDGMREPLNTITGMSQIARRARTPERLKAALSEIEAASAGLAASLGNVLDMSRLEAGTFALASEDLFLKRTVTEVAEVYRALCESKGGALTLDIGDLDRDHKARADGERLKLALSNALDIVARHSEGGEISLSMVAEESETGLTARFEVADAASGLTAERVEEALSQARFFEGGEAFSFAGGRVMDSSLAFVSLKRLTEMMGGGARFEPFGDGGMRLEFEVELPLEDAGDAGEKAAEGLSAADFAKKVLLADDVEVNRMLFAELFSDTDMIIDETEGGEQALEYFANAPEDYYDIVFIDAKMPGMNGCETLRRLRALERDDARKVPVVMMMTVRNQEEAEKAKELGATDCMIKPVDVGKVARLLKEHVRG